MAATSRRYLGGVGGALAGGAVVVAAAGALEASGLKSLHLMTIFSGISSSFKCRVSSERA